jgi:GH15 family glucan-1,4-alpha-glucosidase
MARRIDGYAPIREYAVIGNKRTAALVAADGAIDWLCPAGFDQPSAFGALLDSRRGGAFTLAPVAPFSTERRYRPSTNVLETTFSTEQGSVRVTDAICLPAARPLDFNQIVRKVDGLSGTVAMQWRVDPRFDYGRRAGRIEHRAGVALIVDGEHVLAVQAHGAGEVETAGGAVHGGFACADGDTAVLALSSFDVGPLAFSGADELVERLEATAEHWERWSCGCAYEGPWREAVLRSALALDLMVDAHSGAIIAAPTMALPEQIGGERNYDYRYAWLRDGSLTLEAMLRLGFSEQVHASLRWMLQATAHTHPRLRPMYRIDGRATLADRELALDGYRGSRPVMLGNSAQSQLQLGTYGDVFDMVWRYVRRGNALAGGVAVRLAELADFVCLIWRRPDSGLWELGEERQYTQSKLACALALQRADELAELGMIPASDVPRWTTTRDEIRRYVRERCWSDRLQAYTRAADSEQLDAAVLLTARGSFVADEPERLSSTIDAVLGELGAGGPLLYRYSGMRGQEGAFLACSFWMVEALARCGRAAEAARMMDELVALGSDVGLYSEEIDPASMGFRGNMPQALTHLALVNAADVLRQTAGRSGGGDVSSMTVAPARPRSGEGSPP